MLSHPMSADPMVSFVQGQINDVLDYPERWGTHESVERQLFMLWEMRRISLGMEDEVVHKLQNEYISFMDEQFPGTNGLGVRLGITENARIMFADALNEFEESEKAKMGKFLKSDIQHRNFPKYDTGKEVFYHS